MFFIVVLYFCFLEYFLWKILRVCLFNVCLKASVQISESYLTVYVEKA